MILRPVRPVSPCGPPTTKRPVGLMWKTVSLSRYSAGTVGLMTFSMIASRRSRLLTFGECCVEMTIAVARMRALSFVLDRHLRLAVRPQEIELIRLAHFRQPAHELVRQRDRQRHQLRRLAAREAEHQTLIAGAAGIDALRDVGRLRIDRRNHRAGLAVEAVLRARVADFFDGIAYDRRKVDVGLGGDLTRRSWPCRSSRASRTPRGRPDPRP